MCCFVTNPEQRDHTVRLPPFPTGGAAGGPGPVAEGAWAGLWVRARVEDAVRQGRGGSPGGGGIDIAVDVEGDEVVVEVRNALPPGPDDGGGARHSIGLQATRARVQASTGGRGSVASGREGARKSTRLQSSH